MTHKRPTRLDPPVDVARDHRLGDEHAELTLVEYGNYARKSCHAAHEVVTALRDRFGSRMRYVFRHRPAGEDGVARRAAELAEFAFQRTGKFWPVHDALMKCGPTFTARDLERIAREFNLPAPDGEHTAVYGAAKVRVQQDVESAKRSGVLITPTFFINGRRYEGPWDENTLAEAMLGTLGHRLHAATVEFVRWAPSAGLLLLVACVLAVVLANSRIGTAFLSFWDAPFGTQFGGGMFTLPLLKWINDGLLSIFFLVVGLEIKREFTVGRLSTLRSGALPVVAAAGGIMLPIAIYLSIVPTGPWAAGWAVPIATDTAFAVAILVLLGDHIPVELRVFLTAAVIIDDLVAIAVIAFFYTEALSMQFLIASGVVMLLLIAINRGGIYAPLPYAVLGVVLWFALHEAGLHATLAGVILSLVTPTLPPANLRALTAQAEAILEMESRLAGEGIMRHGPSEAAMNALDAIHRRIESPADKLLRSMQPWSSYFVLPIFALANAGVIMSLDVFHGHSRLMLAVILGLVVGKPVGMFVASWLAVRFHLAVKPEEYSWRQLAGAGALAGIGFTMSLFIASEAYPNPADFAGAKIAIFIASIIAGIVGTAILWPRKVAATEPESLDSSLPAVAS